MPRKTLKQRRKQTEGDKLRDILNISAGKSPDYLMDSVMNALDTKDVVPNPNKYYVFRYKAETKGQTYDAHPFVVVQALFQWGFIGFNSHWGQSRQYNWEGVVSQFHQVGENDVGTVAQIPFARFITI